VQFGAQKALDNII